MLVKLYYFFIFQMGRNLSEQQSTDRQPVKQEESSSYSPQADDVRAHHYSAPSGHYRHYASPPPPSHSHPYGALAGSGGGACALEGCVRYAVGQSEYCSAECRLVAGGDCKEEDDENEDTATTGSGYNNAWPSCMVRPDAATGSNGSDLLVK
jgi:hypothetical protein